MILRRRAEPHGTRPIGSLLPCFLSSTVAPGFALCLALSFGRGRGRNVSGIWALPHFWWSEPHAERCHSRFPGLFVGGSAPNRPHFTKTAEEPVFGTFPASRSVTRLAADPDRPGLRMTRGSKAPRSGPG